MSTRRQNERKLGQWEELSDGGRRYVHEVKGKHGWRACYVKEVDVRESMLVEIHDKYPVDTGHRKLSSFEGL